MSRIGNLPISIPQKVEIEIKPGVVRVTGPKGELMTPVSGDMILEKESEQLIVKRPSESKKHRALHGLTRTLINNMVVGVTEGFTKSLEIVGVGYKVEKKD